MNYLSIFIQNWAAKVDSKIANDLKYRLEYENWIKSLQPEVKKKVKR